MSTSEKTNRRGRNYTSGSAIDKNLRMNIVDEIIRQGGDPRSRQFPGTYIAIAERFRVSTQTVKNIWERFCDSGSCSPKPHAGGRQKKLSPTDLTYIRELKSQIPNITYAQIQKCLMLRSLRERKRLLRLMTQKMASLTTATITGKTTNIPTNYSYQHDELDNDRMTSGTKIDFNDRINTILSGKCVEGRLNYRTAETENIVQGINGNLGSHIEPFCRDDSNGSPHTTTPNLVCHLNADDDISPETSIYSQTKFLDFKLSDITEDLALINEMGEDWIPEEEGTDNLLNEYYGPGEKISTSTICRAVKGLALPVCRKSDSYHILKASSVNNVIATEPINKNKKSKSPQSEDLTPNRNIDRVSKDSKKSSSSLPEANGSPLGGPLDLSVPRTDNNRLNLNRESKNASKEGRSPLSPDQTKLTSQPSIPYPAQLPFPNMAPFCFPGLQSHPFGHLMNPFLNSVAPQPPLLSDGHQNQSFSLNNPMAYAAYMEYFNFYYNLLATQRAQPQVANGQMPANADSYASMMGQNGNQFSPCPDVSKWAEYYGAFNNTRATSLYNHTGDTQDPIFKTKTSSEAGKSSNNIERNDFVQDEAKCHVFDRFGKRSKALKSKFQNDTKEFTEKENRDSKWLRYMLARAGQEKVLDLAVTPCPSPVGGEIKGPYDSDDSCNEESAEISNSPSKARPICSSKDNSHLFRLLSTANSSAKEILENNQSLSKDKQAHNHEQRGLDLENNALDDKEKSFKKPPRLRYRDQQLQTANPRNTEDECVNEQVDRLRCTERGPSELSPTANLTETIIRQMFEPQGAFSAAHLSRITKPLPETAKGNYANALLKYMLSVNRQQSAFTGDNALDYSNTAVNKHLNLLKVSL